MRHLKHLFTALLLMCSTVAMAHDFEVNGIYYNITDETLKTVEVAGSGTCSGDVIIPSTVDYNTVTYSVTSIRNRAFDHCTGLESITIPNSVTSIEAYVFYGCSGLTSITIPNSVTSIGDNAFYDCTGLTNIVVDERNSVYDSRDNCNAIIETATNKLIVGCRNTLIPNNVTSIGDYAFSDCSGLTSITIPSSVTSIGDHAFSGCTGLTSITIPSSVTSIGKWAFYECSGLTNVVIGNGVTSTGYAAFSGCTGLISIEIPNSVTSIGNSAFSGCTGLTSVTIPNSVTSIGNYAFSGCSGLTSVTIPNSVTSIGSSAFSRCSGLTNIVVDEGNSVYDSRDNCNAIIETATNKLIAGCRNTLIPNSVTSIGRGAFYGCTGLTSIEIPNSVTSIGSSAFSDCTGLKEVHIIDLASWWNIAFEGNGSNPLDYAHNLYLNGGLVTELVIPDGVSEIKKYAFSGCTGLTNITIPNSVTSIGNSAFSGCTGLTNITIPNSVTSIGDYAFSDCSGLTSITIPGSVTSIGDHAFYGCTGLTSITIPSSVTSIGNSTFSGCTGLTNITIPNSVTSIGNSTFSGCTGLTSITIPNSVTSIGKRAFDNCTGLESITIPNSVTSIGDCAFCEVLKEVHINDLVSWCNIDFKYHSSNPLYYAHNLYLNGELITELVIPDGVNEIKQYAFSGCTGFTSVTIPNSVTSIGYKAFYDCTGLKTVVNFSNLTFTKGSSDYGHIYNYSYIAFYADNVYNAPNGSIEDEYIFAKPNEVNTLLYYLGNRNELNLPVDYKGENYVIGDSAFFGCKGLTSITIPNSVTSIGERAFYKCTGLKTVINFSKLPFSKGSYNYGYIAYYADNVYNAPNGSIEDEYIFAKPNEVNTLLGYLGSATELTLPGDYKGEDYIIGSGAFSGCSGLTRIAIPGCVTSIGERAFYGCTGLTSITIPNSVTSIVAYVFYGCTGLTSIEIPNSVTSIGNSAFSGCTGLTRVDIVDGVKSIGYSAFASCSNLEELYISNTIESIADCAFKDCTNILEIKVGSKKAITCNENIFSEDVYNNALLYIPEGRKFAYEKTVPWNRFYIVETDFTDISGVKEQIAESKTVYDLQGRKVNNPKNGIYIVNGKKLFVK